MSAATMNEMERLRRERDEARAERDALAALCQEGAAVLERTANDTLDGRNMAVRLREANTTSLARLKAQWQTEAPEWDGRGWPPVGARCAGRHTSFRTDFECTIMAINDGKVWFVDHMDDSDRDFVYPLTCVSFRPIRSEEDSRQAEENDS